MPVISGQRRSQNHQVKRLPPHRLFHSFAAHRGRHFVPRFLNGNRLRSQYLFIRLAIKHFEFERGFRWIRHDCDRPQPFPCFFLWLSR